MGSESKGQRRTRKQPANLQRGKAEKTPPGQDRLLKRLARLETEVERLRTSEGKHKHIREVLQRQTHALGERVKELNCLYAMSSLVEQHSISLAKMLHEVVNIIPAAWQYPEVTCARITLGDEVFPTENYRETAWRQTAPIMIKGKTSGGLDVCYLEKRPRCDEGPFLKEERNLINALAKRIGEIIERKMAEDALKESLARNKSLLNAIPDLILRINKQGSILDCRRGAGFSKKVRPHELMGRNICDLPKRFKFVTDDLARQGMRHLLKVLESGEAQTLEHRIVGRHSTTYYEILVTMIREDEVLAIIRDITERRRLERQVLEISEREQQRIGQDLHDSLCQQLAGIAFLGKVLQQKMGAKSLDEARDAEEIVSLIDDAITQTKALSRGLYPVRLEADGLMTALSELSRTVEKRFNIACRFDSDEPVLIHDGITAVHLYRIVQEAVNNAIKHGRATSIAISLKSDDGSSVLTIRNNGSPFRKVSKGRKGMGLSIMQHRAGMIGASLEIRGDAEGGPVVACTFQNRVKREGQ
jgi:signal transduction histidine kinase